MSAATVTVSIGRNVGAVPMPVDVWRRFRRDVAGYLASGDVFVSDARTVGRWDGVAEESRTWVASIASSDVPSIVSAMAALARAYRQDAIAVSVGQTTLAGLSGAVPVAA